MQGSTLVFGSNRKARQSVVYDTINKLVRNVLKKDLTKTSIINIPDINIVEPPENKKSIGINQVREGIQFLQTKPYSLGKKILVIFEAEKLSLPAQNSLLKTLEEPPNYAVILLEAKTEKSLLDTVVSRCRKVNVKETDVIEETPLIHKNLVTKILKMNCGERLDWAGEISKEDRDDIIYLLESWVLASRKNLDNNSVQNIQNILELIDDLENTNSNARLGLENLVLKML